MEKMKACPYFLQIKDCPWFEKMVNCPVLTQQCSFFKKATDCPFVARVSFSYFFCSPGGGSVPQQKERGVKKFGRDIWRQRERNRDQD
jgi:hypothetical protein